MLGPVGKGWSPEATLTPAVERSPRIWQRSVTETPNLRLWSRVSHHRRHQLRGGRPLAERRRQQEARQWRVELGHDVVV